MLALDSGDVHLASVTNGSSEQVQLNIIQLSLSQVEFLDGMGTVDHLGEDIVPLTPGEPTSGQIHSVGRLKPGHGEESRDSLGQQFPFIYPDI